MPTIASRRILRAIVDERRRALTRSLHAEPACHERPHVGDKLAELKQQAEAFRAQAIVLNAKLKALGDEFEPMRGVLAKSTARIDDGLATIVRAAGGEPPDETKN